MINVGAVGARPVRARLAGTVMRLSLAAGFLLGGCKDTGSRCLALADEGNFPAAHACYDNVLKANPGDAEVWHNAGLLLAIDGRYAQAQGHFLKAVQVKPTYAEAWYNLGLNYQNLGKTEKAIESLDRATKIKPDYRQAWKIKCALLSISGGIISDGEFRSESAFNLTEPYRLKRAEFLFERTAQMLECEEKLRELTRP